jgi:hypothetical protein
MRPLAMYQRLVDADDCAGRRPAAGGRIVELLADDLAGIADGVDQAFWRRMSAAARRHWRACS